jgi:hypothetical protein
VQRIERRPLPAGQARLVEREKCRKPEEVAGGETCPIHVTFIESAINSGDEAQVDRKTASETSK